ncbi:MAG: carboxylating nicotinate-nucleotide diphosphorylase [bacterium]
MNPVDLNASDLQGLVATALAEDLGSRGDVTSDWLLPDETKGTAVIVAKQEGIIAGLPVAQKVFETVDQELVFTPFVRDGDRLQRNTKVAQIAGSARGILTAERTALNFLQRLSGIATLTSQYVAQTQGTKARTLDTRKTTPGLRHLEKYAVRMGGGLNHRMGLHDMVLIKENHIEAVGSLARAVTLVRERSSRDNLQLSVEVETRTLQEVSEALESQVDRIMLDNMPLSEIQEAVRLVGGKVEVEVSGGVTLANVRAIAETGVDYISVGALTHSAPALDLSLLMGR